MTKEGQRFELSAIGHVRSPVTEQRDERWGEVTSEVVVRPEYARGLLGLGRFSHALVVTYLHQARFDSGRDLVRRPRGLAAMPEVGIFAQRAKDRPNPVGISAVAIVDVRESSLVVRGLDAIDGTPVIDIKPYFPDYDRVPDARVPEWVRHLMAGYF